MPQILNIGGVRYEIENWEEFQEKLLQAIGFQIEKELILETNKLGLVNTGAFKQGWYTEVDGDHLIISNTQDYAIYLEYGTFGYWNQYGVDSFPSAPHPKKKTLSSDQKKNYPKGMQPFAPLRRTLWNKNKLGSIIEKAGKVAGR